MSVEDVLLRGSFESEDYRVIFHTISILYHLNCENVLTGLLLSALLAVTIFIFSIMLTFCNTEHFMGLMVVILYCEVDTDTGLCLFVYVRCPERDAQPRQRPAIRNTATVIIHAASSFTL